MITTLYCSSAPVNVILCLPKIISLIITHRPLPQLLPSWPEHSPFAGLCQKKKKKATGTYEGAQNNREIIHLKYMFSNAWGAVHREWRVEWVVRSKVASNESWHHRYSFAWAVLLTSTACRAFDPPFGARSCEPSWQIPKEPIFWHLKHVMVAFVSQSYLWPFWSVLRILSQWTSVGTPFQSTTLMWGAHTLTHNTVHDFNLEVKASALQKLCVYLLLHLLLRTFTHWTENTGIHPDLA